jgi:DNA-binding beta-propeller fold protein YncE
MRGEIKLPDPIPPTWGGFYGTIARNAIRAPGNEIRNCIFVLDRNGKQVESWAQWDHLFEGTNGPHKIRISPYDPERRVWVVNESRHTVYAFSNDGKKLLMTLGEEKVAGNDEKHFGRPQDLTFLPDGSILVADGLTNSRVVKFDKNGKFLTSWGTKGSDTGQLSAVHAVEVDRNRRVYVSDRGNKRIQVFDENGKHLATWPDLRFANHILVSANQDVWVIDNMTAEMVKFDASGKRLFSWHMSGKKPGLFHEVHQFSIDAEGTLYCVDNVLGRIQKFRPRRGADPSQLIGPPVPLMRKSR